MKTTISHRAPRNLRKTIQKIVFLALVLGLATSTLTGCRRLLSRKPDKPPIIIILIDTWRADHAGVYGYQRDITTNIDLFATGAVRFDNAQATASWTVPSIVSLFTGVYPWRHGITRATLDGEKGVKSQPILNPRYITLAESLKAAGYATFGVSANGHLDPKYGMGQGFDNYEVFSFSNQGQVNDTLKKWNRQLRRTYRKGQPYFLFVHYFDPHHPYLPHKKWLDEWRPGFDPKSVADYTDANKFMKKVSKQFFYDNPAEMQVLIDLYDSEIAFVDNSLGGLLSKLPGAKDAVVVVTADHGEAFGDHHNMLHGSDLYRETMRVPLIIQWPGKQFAGRSVTAPVSLVDLYPTLAGWAGAAPPPYLDGRDLRALPDRPAGDDLIYAETHRGDDHHWMAVLSGQYKWMREEDTGVEMLYRLDQDPAETRNLAEAEAEQNARLRELWEKRPHPAVLFEPGDTGKNIDPDLEKKLRNLGYL